MSVDRRRAMLRAGLGVAVLGLAMAHTGVKAQSWPTRPVKMIVPTGAGSSPDVIARLFAERLGRIWGQSVVVDNRPGAGGIPGMSALAHAPRDGYTIGFVPTAMAMITPLVFKNPQFDIDADLVPVATIATGPFLLVANPASGITTIAELASYAKAHPGKVNFAAAQLNSLPHLAGEMLSRIGKLDIFTVPYATPPAAVTAVLSGDAVFTADGPPSLLPHVKSGKLNALAVTSQKRLPGFENIPAVAETYPGYEALGWLAVFAPAGTPAAVQEQINRDVNKVLREPDLVGRLAEVGMYPRVGDQAAAKDFYASQRQHFKRVVADLGLRPQ